MTESHKYSLVENEFSDDISRIRAPVGSELGPHLIRPAYYFQFGQWPAYRAIDAIQKHNIRNLPSLLVYDGIMTERTCERLYSLRAVRKRRWSQHS